MSVLKQIYAYRRLKRPEFTSREVSIFINGMAHASRIATGTTRGHIAAQAINTEMRTLVLHAEHKKVI